MNKNKFLEKYTLNNKVEVPNRLVVAPLTLFASNPDGTINDDEREYLKVRGKGIGLYILGATAVNQEGLTFLGQPRALSEKDLPSLEERAKIIKSQGALAINQIHHGGLKANKEYSGTAPLAPSAEIANKLLKESNSFKVDTKEISPEEIKKIIDGFAYATELSIKSGYDGIEIHGANNFILQQFYSAYTNRRNDEWGGSEEKRMKFPLAIVDACCKVREKLNRPDFIIGYRLSPEEPYDTGLTMTDTIHLVKVLVTKPLQYIHISQWNYFKKAHRGEGAGVERLKTIHEITKGKVALIGVGGLLSEKDLNTAFETGFSEFIGVGCASMINKDFGILLKENKGNQLSLELDPQHPEISVNNLPAGGKVPFVHHHKKNEEIYFITAGSGHVVIDGTSVELATGDWLKINPAGKRQIFAGDKGISYVCIQVKAGSLEGFTLEDGVIDK